MKWLVITPGVSGSNLRAIHNLSHAHVDKPLGVSGRNLQAIHNQSIICAFFGGGVDAYNP